MTEFDIQTQLMLPATNHAEKNIVTKIDAVCSLSLIVKIILVKNTGAQGRGKICSFTSRWRYGAASDTQEPQFA